MDSAKKGQLDGSSSEGNKLQVVRRKGVEVGIGEQVTGDWGKIGCRGDS